MPDIADVSAPGLQVAIVRRKRPPYGWQPVPGGRIIRLGRKPTPLEERLLSLADIPDRLNEESATLALALTLLRKDLLAAGVPPESPDALAETRRVLMSTFRSVASYGAFEHRQEWSRQGVVLSLSDDLALNGIDDDPQIQSVIEMRARRAAQEWSLVLQDLRETHDRVRRGPFEPYAERWAAHNLMHLAKQTVNRGFAFGRNHERRRLHSLKTVEPEVYVYTAVMDSNCFLPGTLVTTERGAVPIESLARTDRILSGCGRYVGLRRMFVFPGKPSISLRAGRSELRVTADHPVLVERKGTLAWRSAGDVKVGDCVLHNRIDSDSVERGFGYANRTVSFAQSHGRFTCVAVPDFGEGMPVVSIDVDQEIERRKVEVPDFSRRHRILASDTLVDADKGRHDAQFEAARSSIFTITNERAESSREQTALPDRELGKTFDARSWLDVGRARLGAHRVAVCIRARHAELFMASRTLLDDALAVVAALYRAVFPNPIAAAVYDGSPTYRTGATSYGLFPPRRVVAIPASHPNSRPLLSSADDTRGHAHIVSDMWTRMSVDSVERIGVPDIVYDIELDRDHTFFADGMIVHNTCGPCEDKDGDEFVPEDEGSFYTRARVDVTPMGDDTRFYQVPSPECAGGPDRCRCIWVAIGGDPGWVDASVEHGRLIGELRLARNLGPRIDLYRDAEPLAE